LEVFVVADDVAGKIRPDSYGYIRRLNASKAVENSGGKLLMILNVWDAAKAGIFIHHHPNITVDSFTGDIRDNDTGGWYDGQTGREITPEEERERHIL
jgi:hypothetical protein